MKIDDLKHVAAKSKQIQGILGPLFCLFCLGQGKICNTHTHRPEFLLDKDLFVWGHQIVNHQTKYNQYFDKNSEY